MKSLPFFIGNRVGTLFMRNFTYLFFKLPTVDRKLTWLLKDSFYIVGEVEEARIGKVVLPFSSLLF